MIYRIRDDRRRVLPACLFAFEAGSLVASVAATAGTNTVTVAFNTATQYVDVRALGYSGLDRANPFDVGGSASGTSNSAKEKRSAVSRAPVSKLNGAWFQSSGCRSPIARCDLAQLHSQHGTAGRQVPCRSYSNPLQCNENPIWVRSAKFDHGTMKRRVSSRPFSRHMLPQP